VVWHEGLFYKLAKLGISGKTLRLLINSYNNLSCMVKLQGMTSDHILVQRSVRQGGVLSTFYYLAFINDLLYDLKHSGYGARISSIKCGNPAFADDISLATIMPSSLQSLVNIVYQYSKQWKFEISIEKSCVINFTSKRNSFPVDIRYGDAKLKVQVETTHLGILQTANMKVKDRINDRCQKAKNSFFAIAGLGL